MSGDITFIIENTFYSQQMPLRFSNVGEAIEHLKDVACSECNGYGEVGVYINTRFDDIRKTWIDCPKCDKTGFNS